MQSPKPVEILSKKSPEKLLLPHPTDFDLETLRSKEEAEAVLGLLLLLLSCSTTMSVLREEPEQHFSLSFAELVLAGAKLMEEILGVLLMLLSLKLLELSFLDDLEER